jgi:hypothetical protein
MFKYCAAFLPSVLLGLLLLPITAGAATDEKNLRGRMGIGFTNQVAVNAAGSTLPALSAKYYLSRSFAFALSTGFDTKSGDSTAVVGLKLFRNLFVESNLIFYGGAGVAYINHAGSKAQGSLFFGSEFFLNQLPSLGLSFEAGIRGDSASGSFAIRTSGDSFLTAGMHFYF